jgi:hypothetical protein
MKTARILNGALLIAGGFLIQGCSGFAANDLGSSTLGSRSTIAGSPAGSNSIAGAQPATSRSNTSSSNVQSQSSAPAQNQSGASQQATVAAPVLRLPAVSVNPAPTSVASAAVSSSAIQQSIANAPNVSHSGADPSVDFLSSNQLTATFYSINAQAAAQYASTNFATVNYATQYPTYKMVPPFTVPDAPNAIVSGRMAVIPCAGRGVANVIGLIPCTIVYFDPNGQMLTRTIFDSAPQILIMMDRFQIPKSNLNTLADALDNPKLNISYNPDEMPHAMGVATGVGINLRDLASGGLGTTYDWRVDANVAMKGPGTASFEQSEINATVADVRPNAQPLVYGQSRSAAAQAENDYINRLMNAVQWEGATMPSSGDLTKTLNSILAGNPPPPIPTAALASQQQTVVASQVAPAQTNRAPASVVVSPSTAGPAADIFVQLTGRRDAGGEAYYQGVYSSGQATLDQIRADIQMHIANGN